MTSTTGTQAADTITATATAGEASLRPGILNETLKRNGISHVTAAEAKELCGANEPGIFIPFRIQDGGSPYGRLRYDISQGQKKYHQAHGSGVHLYRPVDWKAGADLHVIEGEFKALAMTEAGISTLGMSGFHGCMAKGGKQVHPELLLTGVKKIFIWGDSDTGVNYLFPSAMINLRSAMPDGVKLFLPRITLDERKGADDIKEVLRDKFTAWAEDRILEAVEVTQGMTLPQLTAELFIAAKATLANIRSVRNYSKRVGDIALIVKPDVFAYKVLCAELKRSMDFTIADIKQLEETAAKDRAAKAEETAKAAEKKETEDPADTSRIVILPSGPVTLSNAADHIFKRLATTQTMFTRGNRIHEIITDDKGWQTLDIVSETSFCSRLDKLGSIRTYRKIGEEYVLGLSHCKRESAALLLATLEAGKNLPRISTISAAPILTESPDGDIQALGGGYHSQLGGVLVTGKAMPPKVPLEEAVEKLLALFDGFNFQTPSDKSRALAMTISPALKAGGTLDARFPLDVGEADQSQAGKGKRQSIVASIYGEIIRPVVNKSGGVGSFDESIATALIEGRPFIQCDNVRGKINSQVLESILTSSDLPGGRFPCRTPGRPEINVDVRPFNFMLTSNGMESTKDLANRSCISRILKRPEGYEFRTYPEGNILRHIKENQTYYLGCVFAIVSNWMKNGKPATREYRHDFQEWAAALDWIVQSMGLAPLMDGHAAAAERTSNPSLSWLRTVTLALVQDNELGNELTASNIVEVCATHGIDIPGMRKDTAEENAKKIVGCVMAKVFKDKSNIIEVDGYTVERGEKESYYESSGGYKNINVYTFLKA